MADAFVQIAPDGTGKKVDTSEITRADGTIVERQRMVIGDGVDPDGTVRLDASGNLPIDLGPLLNELRITNRLLAVMMLQLASATGVQPNIDIDFLGDN